MKVFVAAFMAALVATAALADEGMWTYHDFPQAKIKQQFGVDISQAWLDRARTATARLTGCTASFVSAEGLILTNHHCADSCLDENSTSTRNLERDGFLARTREQEVRCTTQIADVLMATENITDKISAGTRNLTSQGVPANQANAQAYSLMSRMISGQATTLAYVDIIAIMAVGVLCLAPLAFLMQKPPKNMKAAAH